MRAGPVNAAFALYVLHSFYPAKHTTLILSKARNIPERALVVGLARRERGALVFMEFLGTDS